MAEKRSQANELIAFRDGQPTTDEFREELGRNRELLLRLADSRLLALALSLPRGSDPNSKWPLPSDDELMSYLLNELADDARLALEQQVKENPRVFARMLELREALADAAPSGRVPHLWKRVEAREKLGTARFRAANGHLEFAPDQLMTSRLAPDATRHTPQLGFLASAASLRTLEARAFRLEMGAKKPPVMPVDDQLHELTHKAAQLIETVHRVTQVLEDTLPEVSKPTIAKAIRPLEEAAHELATTIEHLRLATRLERLREPRFAAPLPEMHVVKGEARWHPSLRLQSSHALVSLSGSTGRPMELQIFLQSLEGTPVTNALATLVGPRHSFESAETNAEGRCSFPLEQGASVLLIDAGKPLAEIRLRSSRS